MVGIFSRFSGSKASHRRTQSAVDGREVLPAMTEVTDAATGSAAAAHGIEIAVEFKPVEHPIEPLNTDRPIQCPQPEPSILNDGTLWKERVSATATARRRSVGDLPPKKEEGNLESEAGGTKPPRPARTNRMILPSMSAPEHDLLNLLEECNASGI